MGLTKAAANNTTGPPPGYYIPGITGNKSFVANFLCDFIRIAFYLTIIPHQNTKHVASFASLTFPIFLAEKIVCLKFMPRSSF
jgi:hypothetical protein